MRPLHALLLLVALVAILLAGLFMIGGEATRGEIAPAVSMPAADAGAAAQPGQPAVLLSSDADREPGGREAKPAPLGPSSTSAKSTESSAAKASLELTGRVVTALGKPIGKAQIFADAGGFGDLPLDLSDPKDSPWSSRVDAESGDDGRFSIQPKARGSVRLGVRASGFAPHDVEIPVAGAAQDAGDLVLEESAILEGRVVDPGGRAVAGAELRRLNESAAGLLMLGGMRGVPVAKTDAQGRFRVDQIASGPWKILVTSEDHPDKTQSGETEHPGSVVSNLEFVLEEGSDIQGRITGAPPEALANLWVRASPRPAGEGGAPTQIEAGLGSGAFGAQRRAHCNADGTFTLRGLKKDQTYRLQAREGERDYFGRVRTAGVMAKAGERGVKLEFKPETAIVCQVLDAISGAPIERLMVQAGYRWPTPLMNDDGKPVKQFPEGRVRFANFPGKGDGETAQVHIEAVGYRPFEKKNLALLDGQDLDLGVVRLERAPVVKVLVLDDASGAPVEGARVNLREVAAQRGDGRMSMSFEMDDVDGVGDLMAAHGAQRASTGADGRAQLTSLAGKRATLSVKASQHAAFTSPPILLPVNDDLEQTVRLGVGGTVIVEVVDGQGAPVPGVAIDHDEGGEGPGFPSLRGDDDTTTDAQGHVSFEHLAAGLHRFKTRDEGGGNVSFGNGAIVRTKRVVDGREQRGEGWSEVTVEERAVATLRLVAPGRSSLSGRVTESGKPLASAQVRLVDPDDPDANGPMLPFFGEGSSARTNGKGEYRLDKVKVGQYRALVTHSARAMPHEVLCEIREGENQLDVDLPIAVIEGRITGPDKKPLAGIRVRAERATAEGEHEHSVHQTIAVFATDVGDDQEISFSASDGGAPAVYTGSDGRYTLRGVLTDIDLVVKASGKDAQPGQSEKLRVAPDQTKSHVDLELATGGAIEVTIVRADGSPGKSCVVRAHMETASGDAPDPKTEFTGGGGTARLGGLKPGKWKVNVDPIGAPGARGEPGSIPEQVIEVKAGETRPARFSIP